MSRMSELDIERQNVERAMRGRLLELTADARRIREHLRHCEHSDQQSIDGFDEILKALGIYNDVLAETTQPQQEMAAFDF